MTAAEILAAIRADYELTAADEQVLRTIASEQAAQARVCRVPDPMPADLLSALCRRVARALQMQAKPLGYETGAEGGISFISARDPEIRRLESPFRKRGVR